MLKANIRTECGIASGSCSLRTIRGEEQGQMDLRASRHSECAFVLAKYLASEFGGVIMVNHRFSPPVGIGIASSGRVSQS